MIQLNLLPDIKLEYIKARRMKKLVTSVSLVAAGVSLFVLIILFVSVNILQKKHLNDLNRDIQSTSSKLQNTADLNKILTIQNQLGSLTELHDQKPVASRLFIYLSQVTPDKASISKLDIDFEQSTMAINGSADSLETINKFVDTLKFTTYGVTVDTGTDTEGVTAVDTTNDAKAFPDVVLSNFGKTDKNASYQLTVTFDPLIFDSAEDIKLVVPSLISTRSETEKPAALFQNQATEAQ